MDNKIPVNTNGWTEWSKYVLKTIEDQADDIKATRKAITKIQVDIAMLQVKSGTWGFIGGLFSAVIILAIRFVS